jgi:hypothetical protein
LLKKLKTTFTFLQHLHYLDRLFILEEEEEEEGGGGGGGGGEGGGTPIML